MVVAPHKKHQNDVNKRVHNVHTRKLNWVQNNSILKNIYILFNIQNF
jgi:hypothetical protein